MDMGCGKRPDLLTLRGGGQCVYFSPDGMKLIASDDDGTVQVWSATIGPTLGE